MFKNKNKFIILFLLLISILFCYLLLKNNLRDKTIGDLNQSIILEAEGEETVLDLIKAEKVDFKSRIYTGMGEFVYEINGVKNTSDMVWILYVNGKKAEVGVSNYKLKSGDTVKFNYEEVY